MSKEGGTRVEKTLKVIEWLGLKLFYLGILGLLAYLLAEAAGVLP